MLRIKCPFCGVRDHTEFTYAMDATKPRPAQDNTNIEDWVDYVFMRDNPKGNHEEYWQHTQGCRSLIKVTRHTVTHEITATELAKEVTK